MVKRHSVWRRGRRRFGRLSGKIVGEKKPENPLPAGEKPKQGSVDVAAPEREQKARRGSREVGERGLGQGENQILRGKKG